MLLKKPSLTQETKLIVKHHCHKRTLGFQSNLFKIQFSARTTEGESNHVHVSHHLDKLSTQNQNFNMATHICHHQIRLSLSARIHPAGEVLLKCIMQLTKLSITAASVLQDFSYLLWETIWSINYGVGTRRLGKSVQHSKNNTSLHIQITQTRYIIHLDNRHTHSSVHLIAESKSKTD